MAANRVELCFADLEWVGAGGIAKGQALFAQFGWGLHDVQDMGASRRINQPAHPAACFNRIGREIENHRCA